MRVREAKPAERGVFMRLAHEYLKGSVEKGGWVQDSDANVEKLAKIFDAFTTGVRPGTVKMIGHESVLMAGDMGSVFDLTFIKPAQVFLAHGEYQDLLRTAVVEELKDQGFDVLLTPKPETAEVVKL